MEPELERIIKRSKDEIKRTEERCEAKIMEFRE